MTETTAAPQSIHFKAETRQLLNILIHSLYTEREIFLRELISNASDALTRLEFELLTNREAHDPDLKPAIRVIPDKEAGTLTIRDTGIGMTGAELVENLGTIAHSGARAFVEAAQAGQPNLSDIIGQFGVGFYSAFMAADWIRVVSRSYLPEAEAAAWYSDGSDTYQIEAAEKEARGTDIILKLKEDAQEFLEPYRLRQIVSKHSDFVAYPIYITDQEEQANRQTALWRQQPHSVKPEEYNDFYKQLTLDFTDPLAHAHMLVDAPVQMYAVLFIPASPERSMFSTRKEDGLKLYARKILIQEYNKDLLPDYLGFVQGVVDSEDLPLNVSRESIQANRIMVNLKKLVTSKVFDTLKRMAEKEPEKYEQFWLAFGRYLKQGVATEPDKPEDLYPFLRFRTTSEPEKWSSLDDYINNMVDGQEDIYYIIGDDEKSVLYSPHLDAVRRHGYAALLLTDPLDAFMLPRLASYRDHKLVNVSKADLELPAEAESQKEAAVKKLNAEQEAGLVERFAQVLGERVVSVRTTKRLADSPARLVDAEDAPNPEMQRVYRLLNKDFEIPKKILELNPQHPLITGLEALPAEDPRNALLIEQIFENALLIEGLHPEPASMIKRIQSIMQQALE